MLRAIQIRVFPGEQSGYVAECIDLPVVSQGETIDAALENVREALELHLQGEDCRAERQLQIPGSIRLEATLPAGCWAE